MTDQASPRSIEQSLGVVGVDRSPGSKSALQWAMTPTLQVGAGVRALATWQDLTMVAATP
jgi:hypothetical protein